MKIVKNLLLAIIFVAVLSVGTHLLLGIITRHSESIAVPDLTNLQVPQAVKLAEENGLKVVVVDSVFVRRMAKGAVFSQTPKAGSRVKDGRTISVVTNSVVPKKVTMPDLVGLTLRQAKADLSRKGLYLGKIIYVSDMATNNVLRQFYHHAEIRPGKPIESGSVIDLQVGLNEDDSITNVPDVRGMKYLRAVDAIQISSLNVGRLKFDSSVKTYTDSLNSVVISQSPLDETCNLGSEVSLTLSVDPDKIN